MRRVLTIIAILSLLLLDSCKTKYIVTEKEFPIETVKTEYKTDIKYDSIYIHDSINTYFINDTIYKEKTHVVYKKKILKDTLIKCDTIEKPVYITKTEIQEVEKTSAIDRFLMSIGCLLVFLIIFAGLVYILKNKIFKI